MTETPKPYAAATTDYLGCEYFSFDVENIEKIAAAGSQGPTEVVYLYAGSPPPQSHVMGMRDTIANIIDPHSFMPDNSGDYIVGEIVKQSRELALSKADRILAALSAPEAEG